MNPEEYDRMYRLEDRYWWYVGRRRLALRLLHRFLGVAEPPRPSWERGDASRNHQNPDFPLPSPPPNQSLGEGTGVPDSKPQTRPTVVDLGCGTGAVLTEMTAWARPIGTDLSAKALKYCRSRGLKDLVEARGEALPFLTDSVDAVIALDVFEHIDDDASAIGEAFRILRPGGVLVLSVPAFKSLWGPHDVALHHFRRYTRPEMALRLKQAGFKIERASYSVFFLFPLVWLIRQVEKGRKGPAQASLPPVPGWINGTLVTLQKIEAFLITRMALPWGSSVVCVARKPR